MADWIVDETADWIADRMVELREVGAAACIGPGIESVSRL